MKITYLGEAGFIPVFKLQPLITNRVFQPCIPPWYAYNSLFYESQNPLHPSFA